MNEIELKLNQLLTKSLTEPVDISEDLINEFGESCKAALRKQFNTKREEGFRLRMSNLGKDLRQLHLDKLYGSEALTPDKKLLFTYGDMIESLMVVLMKASGVEILEEAAKVKLNVAGEVIKGELDLIYKDSFTGKRSVIDVKSASPYSYDNKFTSYDALKADDPFGYRLQLFDYHTADKVGVQSDCAGGWLVVNKVNGKFIFLEVPSHLHDEEQELATEHTIEVVEHFKYDKPIPPCTGVENNLWRKKETGEKILGKSCQYCPNKSDCHPGIEYRQGENGVGYKWYLPEDK